MLVGLIKFAAAVQTVPASVLNGVNVNAFVRSAKVFQSREVLLQVLMVLEFDDTEVQVDLIVRHELFLLLKKLVGAVNAVEVDARTLLL